MVKTSSRTKGKQRPKARSAKATPRKDSMEPAVPAEMQAFRERIDSIDEQIHRLTFGAGDGESRSTVSADADDVVESVREWLSTFGGSSAADPADTSA